MKKKKTAPIVLEYTVLGEYVFIKESRLIRFLKRTQRFGLVYTRKVKK